MGTRCAERIIACGTNAPLGAWCSRHALSPVSRNGRAVNCCLDEIRNFLQRPLSSSSSANMAGDLLFVHGLQVEERERRLMRRHVMLRKNAGKTILRRSRLQLHSKPPSHQHSHCNIDCSTLIDHNVSEDQRVPAQPRFQCVVADGLDHVFLTLRCPVEVCQASRQIIHDCMYLPSARGTQVLIRSAMESSR